MLLAFFRDVLGSRTLLLGCLRGRALGRGWLVVVLPLLERRALTLLRLLLEALLERLLLELLLRLLLEGTLALLFLSLLELLLGLLLLTRLTVTAGLFLQGAPFGLTPHA